MTDRMRYCPSCGEDVPIYEFSTDKGVELRCTFCSFPLEQLTFKELESTGTLIVADDAETMVCMISDFFDAKKLFHPILKAKNGGEVLQILAECWNKSKSVKLIILDIKMPVLNGAQVAIAIRWIEKGFQLQKPTPLIFLSAVRITDDLKKVMEYCQPSFYINKASAGGTPEELLNRMEQVARRLLLQ